MREKTKSHRWKNLDPSVKEWRDEHREEVKLQLNGLLKKAYRRSQSKRTAECLFSNVLVFCSWLKKLPNEIIRDIKEGRSDPYKILDNYVDWLVEQEMAPNSIKGYLSSVKRFLVYNDVILSNERIREKVELPRTYTVTRDVAPTPEESRQILLNTDTRGKALILLLASSGMRISEALSLRVKDIEFDEHPTKIRLRAEVTKDRQARICFISDEAKEWLKKYLGERINDPNNYLFPSTTRGFGHNKNKEEAYNNPMSYWNADAIFTNALKADLRKIDENGRDLLRIHSLRKFFFTQMVARLGREVTEALMGHKPFLDSAYRRFTEEQLGEFYLKAMSAVTVLKEPSKAEMKELEKRLEEAEKRIKRYEDFTKKFMELSPEELDELALRIRERREEKLNKEVREAGTNLNLNGGYRSFQRVIKEEEVETYLNQGWRFVANLNNSKVVVESALS